MFTHMLSNDSRRNVMPLLFCAAFTLFSLAMFLPSVSSSPNAHGELVCENAYWAPGWELLMTGWLGPIQGQFGWFANPFMMMAMFLINRKSGVYFAGAAVALALISHVTFTSTLNDVGGMQYAGLGGAIISGLVAPSWCSLWLS